MCDIKRYLSSIANNEAFRTILFTVVFQMILPFTDSGTDIRLGIRLWIHGHPKWAISVMMPVFVNTFFTCMACRVIEKKETDRSWAMYLPLVILQVYPQFCICRLLLRYYRGTINLEEFKSARDSMDGGIGCVEPYCESVPQVYIQTAIFAYIHNIDQLVKRLCFTAKNRSCEKFDNCDQYDCHIDRYSSGYNRYSKYSELNDPKHETNCFTDFQECIRNFSECIDICKGELKHTIRGYNESELYQFVTETKGKNQSELHAYVLNIGPGRLVKEHNATLDDIDMIEMRRLVIENYGLFIFTYMISIVAAAYGISKFFRLGHTRIVTTILSRKFAAVLLVNTVFFILKGVVLVSIVMENETHLVECMLW
jgi:hypothetical protein